MKKEYFKNKLVKSAILLVGMFLISINYNMFLLPNSFVIGGTSGLSIIVNKIFDLDAHLFIIFANSLLSLFSIYLWGFKKTWKNFVGAMSYSLMIAITLPLTKLINFQFDSVIITIIVAAILYGLGNGLIYKMGFTTGGSDIVVQMISQYKKITKGKSIIYTNVLIIVGGAISFGIDKMIYALIILYAGSIIVDKIMLGISDSKLFFIYSTKINTIKKFILKDITTGATILNTEGGYSCKKNKMIMCVVRTRDYFLFKEKILEIDPNAFFIINDCYEAFNGVKRKNLPFIKEI